MTSPTTPQMNLYDRAGGRLYVNLSERKRFLAVIKTAPAPIRTLGLTLLYTGCRASEALTISPSSIGTTNRVIAIQSLKKRDVLLTREVPVPQSLIVRLQQDHDLNDANQLWSFDRTTVWRQIKNLMHQAEIYGPQACPKGLRHGFGIKAIQAGVPLNLLQKWMGHASIEITALYTNAVGPEEYSIARKMWLGD